VVYMISKVQGKGFEHHFTGKKYFLL